MTIYWVILLTLLVVLFTYFLSRHSFLEEEDDLKAKGSVAKKSLPEGFVPLPAFSMWPPGGACGWLIFMAVSYAIDLNQVLVMFHAGNRIAGWLCVCGLCTAVYLTIQVVVDYERSPLHIMREALAHGRGTLAWQELRTPWATYEAPIFGIVAPYVMLTNPRLGPFSAFCAGFGFLSACIGVAVAGASPLRGDAREEAAGTIYPRLQELIYAWCIFTTLTEFACFAVASVAFHPLFVAMFYIPSAIVNWLAMERKMMWFTNSLLQPSFLFLGGIGCILDPENLGKVPHALTRPLVATTLLRHIGLLSALCLLNLPDGILPLSTLDRPMGHEVLWAEMVHPAFGALGSLLSSSRASLVGLTLAQSAPEMMRIRLWDSDVMPDELSVPTLGSSSLSLEASVFRTSVLAVWVFATPFYVFCNFCILYWRSSFTEEGITGPAFRDRLWRKQEVIARWGEARASSLGFDSVPLGNDNDNAGGGDVPIESETDWLMRDVDEDGNPIFDEEEFDDDDEKSDDESHHDFKSD